MTAKIKQLSPEIKLVIANIFGDTFNGSLRIETIGTRLE